ncbi:MAG TPA: hypothetical protein VFQ63_01310 [Patescibacteria group bacterium]|nr:hypothetical protein [Patescibacteria group bacterium]
MSKESPKTAPLLYSLNNAGLSLLIDHPRLLPQELLGRENLEGLPKGAKIIFATSHKTDADIPIALAALGRDFPLQITNQSTQHSFLSGGADFLVTALIGRSDFHPISYTKRRGRTTSAFLNPSDFVPLNEALENGKTVVVAAHNPGSTKGGIAAAFLAELSQAYIIPVDVEIAQDGFSMGGDLKTLIQMIKNWKHKPQALVRLGQPIAPSGIDVQTFSALLEKRGNLSDGERREFRSLLGRLRDVSAKVMANFSVITR